MKDLEMGHQRAPPTMKDLEMGHQTVKPEYFFRLSYFFQVVGL